MDGEENVADPVAVLSGHSRRVACVEWNPVAGGILATASVASLALVACWL